MNAQRKTFLESHLQNAIQKCNLTIFYLLGLYCFANDVENKLTYINNFLYRRNIFQFVMFLCNLLFRRWNMLIEAPFVKLWLKKNLYNIFYKKVHFRLSSQKFINECFFDHRLYLILVFIFNSGWFDYLPVSYNPI